MKTSAPCRLLSLAALTLLFAAACPGPLRADPPQREGLPPGLQKKDKLPPGWQKKTGSKPGEATTAASNAAPATTSSPKAPEAPTSSVPNSPAPVKPTPTTTSTPTTTTTTTPTTTTPSGGITATKPEAPRTTPTVTPKPLTKVQRENLVRMEQALGDLETQAARPGASPKLLQRLSNRQNIPQATLEGQLKSNPGLTIPQLYLATLIAREARVPSDQILKDHKTGAAWGDIAHTLNVPFSDLAERLRAAEQAAKEAANEEQVKTRKAAAR